MPHIEKPSILVIDDEPDALCNEVALGLNNKASANVVHPHEVELSQLQNADLVLVDFRLDRWNERDAQSAISLQPATGLALAVVLREQVDQSDTDELTAFALYSAHLSDIQGRLPLATAQHVLARLNNLEWAFPKTEPRRYQQMVLLAAAVRKLPRTWPQDAHGSTAAGQSLLAIQEDGKSFERCWRDVLECRPPVHELTAGGHGILFVRWLLHQIMPYPSILWAEHWVAAILGDSDEPPFPKSLPIPRLPSIFVTPMSAVEFVLGELYQDEWAKASAQNIHDAQFWRTLQKRRLRSLFSWCQGVLKHSTSSPWVALKTEKPKGNEFLVS